MWSVRPSGLNRCANVKAVTAILSAMPAAALPADSLTGGSPAIAPILLNLLLVLAVILGLAWFLRRSPLVGKTDGPLEVKGSLSIGQKERLVLVRFAERELLLGVNGQRITLLAETLSQSESDQSNREFEQLDKPFLALLGKRR